MSAKYSAIPLALYILNNNAFYFYYCSGNKIRVEVKELIGTTFVFVLMIS